MPSDNFYRSFNKCSNKFSADILLRNFTKSTGSVYDDDVSLSVSGADQWIKGTIQSLDKTEGSSDANLLEQGKLIYNDTKIYFHGSIVLTGNANMFKLQIGSPTGDWFSLIPLGAINRQVNGSAIFETAYLRRLTTGSILGE